MIAASREKRERRARSALSLAIASLALAGCAPTVDVLGVYFPGWLISAIVGVALAYLGVWWIGRRAKTRELAGSGLFFLSLALGVSLSFWWLLYSAV